tara:strand:- start:609 stop:1421 length:813 start_codon:yes stop_codon:yes gene_type:complete
MAVTVSESWGSRKRSISAESSDLTLTYLIEGTDNDSTAYNALVSTSPTSYVFDSSGRTLYRQTVAVERVGESEWSGSVKFGSKKGDENPSSSSYDFDTGGGTTHLANSIATVSSYAASGTAPNFGNLIGVTKDAVEGVDVTIPQYRFSETHEFDVTTITAAYKTTLFGLTGSVNSVAFKGFAIGECLFMGASGAQKGEEDWSITYNFACQPNASSLSVGTMTGIVKRGWDYLWVVYDDAEDSTAKRIIKTPVAAYVEQVYEYKALAGLGI